MIFWTLVRLCLRDLARRRFLWGLVVVGVALLAVAYWSSSSIENAIGQGQSFTTAARQATARLDSLAGAVREALYIGVVLLAAQVAPESRKNGTTQFVLTFGVSRETLAAAQLFALALVVSVATFTVHAGFGVAYGYAHSAVPRDLELGGLVLLAPMLAGAACSFAVSLTAGSIETYLLFLGVPFVGRSIPEWMGTSVQHVPLAIVRLVDNVTTLFPPFAALAPWPHLAPPRSEGGPFAQWGWPIAQAVLATAFWIVLGAVRLRRHDFGSRTAAK